MNCVSHTTSLRWTMSQSLFLLRFCIIFPQEIILEATNPWADTQVSVTVSVAVKRPGWEMVCFGWQVGNGQTSSSKTTRHSTCSSMRQVENSTNTVSVFPLQQIPALSQYSLTVHFPETHRRIFSLLFSFRSPTPNTQHWFMCCHSLSY